MAEDLGNVGGGMPDTGSGMPKMSGDMGGSIGGGGIKQKLRYVFIVIAILAVLFGILLFLNGIGYALPFEVPEKILWTLSGVCSIITGVYSLIYTFKNKSEF